MKLPTTINNLSLIDYIQVNKIKAQTFEYEADRTTAYLSYFTGLTPDYFDGLSPRERKKYNNKIIKLITSTETLKRKKSFWIKGKRYVAAKDELDFNTNQWTALNEFEKDATNNIHKIIALIYTHTPLFCKWKFKDSEFTNNAKLFNDTLKVKDFIGTFFFYSQRLELLRETSLAYSKINEMEINEHMKEVYRLFKELGINTDGSLSYINSQVETILKGREY